MDPIPLAKRQRMQSRGDYTVNAVGDDNATRPMRIVQDATTVLVDGLVRDGWVLPENRHEELAALYQAQMRTAHRQSEAIRNANAAKRYADGWVARMLAHMGEHPE